MHSKVFGFGSRCQSTLGGQPSQTSPLLQARSQQADTIVKNTFLEFRVDEAEDEDSIFALQKCRRSARTLPQEFRCGDDSPAYVPLPVSPLLCNPSPPCSSDVLKASTDTMDNMQKTDRLGAEDSHVLMDFKPVIKNTFIQLDVSALEDDDMGAMQNCRRDSKTCPHDLGCREDMPAYVSVPASPCPHNSSLSASWQTDISSWQAADLGSALYSLGHSAPNGEDLASMEKDHIGIQESPSYQIAPGQSDSMMAPTLLSNASLAPTSEQLLGSGDACAVDISVKPTVSRAYGTRESPDCKGPCSSADLSEEAVSASRLRLRSYGNQYSASCCKSVQQPISLDSLVRSGGEQVPATSPFSSNISFMQSSKLDDEVSLYRVLMQEDRPKPETRLPPPPPYSAPSFDMLRTAYDTMQTQPASESCMPTSRTDQPSTSALHRPPRTITEMFLLSSSAPVDVAAAREDADIEAVQNPPGTITGKSSFHSSAHPDALAGASRVDVDMEAHRAELERSHQHRGRPRGRRCETVKPAQQASSVREEGVALLTPAALPLEAQAATLSAARSIAKKSHTRNHADRLWCHLYIDKVMLADGFDLVKKIIGREGCNTRTIYNETSTKVRVRGQGSGHRELRSKQEAPVHLMMALAADHGCREDFKRAFVMAVELLQDVSRRFEGFSRRKHQQVQAGPRFWVGESTDESLLCLSDVLGDIPVGRLDLES